MRNNSRTMEISVTWGEGLYYVFFVLMLMAKGLGWYEGMFSYNLVLVVSLSCILLKVMLEKHTFLEAVLETFLVTIAGLVYLTSRDKAPIIFIFMIIGLKNISVKKVFRIGAYVLGACFAWRAFWEVTGIRLGFVLAHEKFGLGPILRWSFGYPHPNVLQITYAVLAAFILYSTCRTGKRQWRLLLLLFAGSCYVFLYSLSYTGFILTSLLLIAVAYFMERKKFGRIEKGLMYLILPVCVVVSLAVPFMVDSTGIARVIGQIMNRLINQRFLASSLYLKSGVAPFGRDFSLENIGFALDSSYVSLLAYDGYILFVLMITAYMITICQYIRKGKRMETAIILTFLIAGVSEPFLFNTSFKNITLLFVGECMFEILSKAGGKEFGSTLGERSICVWIPIKWTGWKKEIDYRLLWKKRGALILLAGALAGGGYWLLVPEEVYYVDMKNTTCAPQEEIYLVEEQIEKGVDGVILSYPGPDQPMYRFSGTTSRIEKARRTMSWAGIGCMIVGSTCVFMQMREKGKS